MYLLSKFIIKTWFFSLMGSIMVFFLLITTADLLNGLIQGKDISIVFLEYLLKMPQLLGKVLPITTLVASLFTFNKLKTHSELVSLLASGVSYAKIYTLIGFSSISIVFLQFLNLGFLEPFATKIKRQEIAKSQKSDGRYLTRSSIDGGRFLYKSKDYFVSFAFFDKTKHTLNDVEIYRFDKKHLLTSLIKAKKASFIEEGKWNLSETQVLNSLEKSEFCKEEDLPNLSINILETPEDFSEFEADITTLNFFKLSSFIKKLSKTEINIAEYKILLYQKVSLSLTCLIFALIPLSALFTPNRRSSSFGKNVVFTLLVSILFWVLYSATIAFGNSGSLSPFLSTTLVPFLFLAYVIATFSRHVRLHD